MRFGIQAELVYHVSSPASFLFNVAASKNRLQRLSNEQFDVSGGTTPEELLWNGSRFHRVQSTGPELRLKYTLEATLTPETTNEQDLKVLPLPELPTDVLVYLFPSRYCQSDLLARFARSEFMSPALNGFGLVMRICNWIYEKVAYQRGATTSLTSAYDTATERQGVCRDFAHLGIALCRALGIPARFVSAYAYGLMPPDFHAIFEVYLGGRWHIFDATRLAPQTSFVRMGVGRDAADTAFATFYGGASLAQMNLKMECLSEQKPEFVVTPIRLVD